MLFTRRIILSWTLFILMVSQCIAQDTLFEAPNTGISDEPPVNKKGQWVIPVSLATLYVGLTGICYEHWDTDIKEDVQEHKNKFETTMSGAVTNFGLGKYQALALGTTTLYAFITRNARLKKTVIIWAGSLVINSVTTDFLKKTFQRHRPSTGDPFNSFDWRGGSGKNVSFPSAHTSNIFTTATVFASLYPEKKWVAPTMYTLATMVGLSRIYDNAHWASDVLAGAAVGFLSAKAMIAIYNTVNKRLMFSPSWTGKQCAVSIIYQL